MRDTSTDHITEQLVDIRAQLIEIRDEQRRAFALLRTLVLAMPSRPPMADLERRPNHHIKETQT
jgi:hypothetical protein